MSPPNDDRLDALQHLCASLSLPKPEDALRSLQKLVEENERLTAEVKRLMGDNRVLQEEVRYWQKRAQRA